MSTLFDYLQFLALLGMAFGAVVAVLVAVLFAWLYGLGKSINHS